LLILSPPKELSKEKESTKTTVVIRAGDMLQQDFLKQDFLKSELATDNPWGDDPLNKPLLQQYFLENIFNILSEQLQAETQALLGNVLQADPLLPDYNKSMRITVVKGVDTVTLTKDNGSDVESVMVPRNQNSLIVETQGSSATKNRVNAGGNTYITVTQK
jgi:hypothetical protein